MHPPSWSIRLPAVLTVALVLVLTTACSGTTSVSGSSTPSVTPTATATAVPTTCAQLPGFAGATPATPLAGFNYGVPTGTVAAAPVPSAGAAGQYTLYDINFCAPNTTTALPVGANQRPLATALQFYGWGTMTAFPATGDALTACVSPAVCYGYNVETHSGAQYFGEAPRFLALSGVQDRGNGLVTFHFKLAAPPTAPNCAYDSNYDSVDQTAFGAHPIFQLYLGAPTHTANDMFSGVQLPPVTRIYGQGAAGHTYYQACSAGSAASVNAFMFGQLTTNGWTGCSGQPAPTAAGGCFAYSYTAACGTTVTQITIAATDAAKWTFGYGRPCLGG